MNRVRNIIDNFWQCAVAADQLVYCVAGTVLSLFNPKVRVHADLTLSAAAYRKEQQGERCGHYARMVIDTLFLIHEKEHCRKAYEGEMSRTQLPDDMRQS